MDLAQALNNGDVVAASVKVQQAHDAIACRTNKQQGSLVGCERVEGMWVDLVSHSICESA